MPAPNIPNWLKGRDFTSLILRRQAVAANGELSNAVGSSDVELAASKVGFEYRLSPEHADLSVDNATVKHHVILVDDYQISMRVQMPNIGGDPHPILTEILQGDIFKLTFVYGATAAKDTHIIYGVRGEYGEMHTGKSASVASFDLLAIDVNQAPLAIS